jgi:hypothetical protein
VRAYLDWAKSMQRAIQLPIGLARRQLQSSFRPQSVFNSSNNSPVSVQQQSRKAVVLIVEMAEMRDLSKARFPALIRAGSFPKPVRHQCCECPVFDEPGSAITASRLFQFRRSGRSRNRTDCLPTWSQ